MQDIPDRLTISTPESVDVVLDLAGPGTRISSGAVDLVLQGIIGIVGAIAIGALASSLGDDWAVVAGSIGAFLLIFFYDVAWELLNDGRTPGKALLGLRVVRDDGRRVDGASSVVRNLLRIIELPLSYAPGIVLITWTRRHQRIGDMVAGTLVVREPRRSSKALDRSRPGAPGGSPGARAEAGAPAGPSPWSDDGARSDAETGRPGSPGHHPAPHDPWAPSPTASLPTEGLRLDTAGLTDHDRSTARAFAQRHLRLDPEERRKLAELIAAGLRTRLGGVPPGLGDEDLVLEVARGSSLRG